MTATITLLQRSEIPRLVSALEKVAWATPPRYFEKLLEEQEAGRRVVLVARADGDFAGYVTINWESNYPPFAEAGIPEIVDLRVLPEFRRRGIATALVDEAERHIFAGHPAAGIGVGLYAHYGPAQQMYVRRGYVPDGRGICYNNRPVSPGDTVAVDDALILYFIKEKTAQ